MQSQNGIEISVAAVEADGGIEFGPMRVNVYNTEKREGRRSFNVIG